MRTSLALMVAIVVWSEGVHAQQPAAQPAQFLGFLYVQGTSTPIAGASVAFESLGRTTTTDADGHFRIAGIRPGNQILTIKKVGFVALKSMMAFRSDDSVDTDLTLARTQAAQTLAAVKVEERSMRDWKRHEFEDRRAKGAGGRFITRADIDVAGGSGVAELLARINGPSIQRSNKGSRAWAVTSRGVSSIMRNGQSVLASEDLQMGANREQCYTAVIVDGVEVYTGGAGQTLFDLNAVNLDDLAGVEFYPGGATIPAKYAGLRVACGLLILWMR
jgi:hypothetical protein